MLNWKVPTLEDIPEMKRLIFASGSMGSDSCAANIYLLREKYNIKIAITDEALFRLYTGKGLPGRDGIAFPLGSDPEKAVDILLQDRQERGLPASFVFLSDKQREIVSSHCPGMIFDTSEGNSDYTYMAQHLAQLSGRKNVKKRNRVNHFCREFPEHEIRFVESDDPSEFLMDMIEVEERWFALQEERPD
jgi:hypothetical protein